MADWAAVNQLPLNTSKCKVLSLHSKHQRQYILGDHPIPTSMLEKDLGVFIQPNLNNSQQAAQAACSANRHLGLIHRTFGLLTEDIARTLITLYIRPHTEYAIQAWSPWLLKDRRALERPQRRATKLVKGIRHLPYSNRLQHLNLFSVAYRRIRGDLILAYYILHNPTHPCKDLLTLSKQTTSEPPIQTRVPTKQVRLPPTLFLHAHLPTVELTSCGSRRVHRCPNFQT